MDTYDLDIFLTLFLLLQLYVRERFGVLLVSSAIYLTYPKPADRGLRLGTSFFISHSRFGVLVDFSLVCAVASDLERVWRTNDSCAGCRKNLPRVNFAYFAQGNCRKTKSRRVYRINRRFPVFLASTLHGTVTSLLCNCEFTARRMLIATVVPVVIFLFLYRVQPA